MHTSNKKSIMLILPDNVIMRHFKHLNLIDSISNLLKAFALFYILWNEVYVHMSAISLPDREGIEKSTVGNKCRMLEPLDMCFGN